MMCLVWLGLFLANRGRTASSPAVKCFFPLSNDQLPMISYAAPSRKKWPKRPLPTPGLKSRLSPLFREMPCKWQAVSACCPAAITENNLWQLRFV